MIFVVIGTAYTATTVMSKGKGGGEGEGGGSGSYFLSVYQYNSTSIYPVTEIQAGALGGRVDGGVRGTGILKYIEDLQLLSAVYLNHSYPIPVLYNVSNPALIEMIWN